MFSFCYMTFVANGQKPVYPIPGEDHAKYNRKANTPRSIYENHSIPQRPGMPPKDYLQTTFDSVLRQFKVNTAVSRYAAGSVNTSLTKRLSLAAKTPVSTSACFRLTKDINTTTGNSIPQNLIPYGPYSFAVMSNVSYFSADDGIHGTELWGSDGTAAGTYLVKDINPGSGGSDPNGITAANGLLFFYAQTLDTGVEPWVSDGTESGTHLLMDIYAGQNYSLPNQFVNAGGSVFFVTSLFGYNHQLWKTDGTEAGTSLVKDLQEAGIGYNILELTAVNDIVYFIAYTWAPGFQLFRSDGTDAGTYMVKQIGSYLYDYTAPMHLTAYNGQLYFSVDDGTGGRRLWVSDGTEAGTNYAPGFNDVFIHQEEQSIYSNEPFSILNNVLYISGFTYAQGSGLYKYDASNADGIVLVKDITPVSDNTLIPPPYMEVVNNMMYFKVNTYIDGLPHDELWSTDGAAANTLPVKVFVNGEGLFSFYNSNGVFFFSKFDYVSGQELWKSNGTDAGTVIVKDIIQGTNGSSPENFTFCNGKLLFRATDNDYGMELWSTDGTGPGTSLVKDINSSTTNGSNAGFFYRGLSLLGNGVVFNAYTPQLGGELYKSDGTASGTVLLNDINTGVDWSYPNGFLNKNGFSYFIGDDATGTALYRTNGTTAGLKRMTAYILRDNYFVVNFNVTDNGQLFYILGHKYTGAYELWYSDGSDAGSYVLNTNIYNYNNYVIIIGNTGFFVAGDDANGYELWKSNGTVAGTKLVKDIYAGVNGSYPFSLFAYKKVVYFGAYDGFGYHYSFWKSDGTDKGTEKLANVTIAFFWENFADPANQVYCISNNILYFLGTDFNTYGAELWSTNGTKAGTKIVKDINPYFDSYPNSLTDVNGTLFFSADDGVNGTELWSSKGTANTTKMVKDITPGFGTSLINNFCGVGNKLYFLNGFYDLWSSDGTANNTTQVTDPGLSGLTNFGRLVNGGGKLFFSAYSNAYGYELFVGGDCSTASRPIVSQPVITETPQLFDVLLYPNPSNGPASLKLSEEAKNVIVTITDISGKVFWQSSFNNATQINLPVDKLATGIYMVTVKSSAGNKSLKLIKQ